MNNSKWIFFDMDGTLNRFYDVDGWLPMLINSDPTPYRVAAPMVNMNALARRLNRLQREGYKIGIISWLSKNSTPEYDEMVKAAKLEWLHAHLRSVKWDAVHIVEYGMNKWEICGGGILFDDEKPNRDSWGGAAYHPKNMMAILSSLRA